MASKSKKVSAIIGTSILVAGSGIAYMTSHNSSNTNKEPDEHATDKDSSQKSISSLKIKTNRNVDAQKLSNYIVVKGDSTMSLAKRFNVTESSLLKKFNLSKNDKLIPGVKMKDQANKIHEKMQASSSSSSSVSQVSSSDTNTAVTTDDSTSGTASSEQIVEQSTPQVQTPQPAPAVPTPAQPVVPQQAPVKQAPVQETPAPAPVQQAPAPVPVEQTPAPAQRPTAPSTPSSDPNSTNIGSASDIMNSLG